MMRMALLVSIAAGLALAQPPAKSAKKTPPKPFAPPTILPMVDPVLAKDEACAKDLAKILDMEGLALRKYVAELVKFGCVKRAEGSYYVNPTSITLYRFGKRQVNLTRVHLINMDGGGAVDGWVLGLQIDTLEGVRAAIRAIEGERSAK